MTPRNQTIMIDLRTLDGLTAFSARRRRRPGQLSEAMPVRPTWRKLRRESGLAQGRRGEGVMRSDMRCAGEDYWIDGLVDDWAIACAWALIQQSINPIIRSE